MPSYGTVILLTRLHHYKRFSEVSRNLFSEQTEQKPTPEMAIKTMDLKQQLLLFVNLPMQESNWKLLFWIRTAISNTSFSTSDEF